MSSEKTFNDEIVRIVTDVLDSGEIEELLRKQILDGLSDAFNRALSWGNVKKAIENRLNEVLVPFIESYDMSEYVVKLDAILHELIKESAVADNRKILQNFSTIMKVPERDEITLDEIFSEYCSHVARYVDTSNLDVDTDDEPTYVPVEAVAEIVVDEKPCGFISSFDRATLYLRLDESEHQQEDLCFAVRLMRRKKSRDENWDILFDTDFRMSNLAAMSAFECFLIALVNGNVKLNNRLSGNEIVSLKDLVTPDATPEATFS